MRVADQSTVRGKWKCAMHGEHGASKLSPGQLLVTLILQWQNQILYMCVLYACTLYHNGLSMNAQWRAEAYVHRTVKVESRLQFDRDKSQPLSHKIELQAAAKLCGRLLAMHVCIYLCKICILTWGTPNTNSIKLEHFHTVDNNWHLNRVYLSVYKNCDNAQSILYYFFITLYCFPVENRGTHYSVEHC